MNGCYISEISGAGSGDPGVVSSERETTLHTITREAIEKDVNLWFSEPESEQNPFHGILVFERTTPVKTGPMRLGLKADEYLLFCWEKRPLLTLPFTSQPSAAWSGARCIGLAKTREEALQMLFPAPG